MQTAALEILLSAQNLKNKTSISQGSTLTSQGMSPNIVLENLVQPFSAGLQSIQSQAPASSLSVHVTDPSLTSTEAPGARYPEGDGFDALFEEMVTSVPVNRQESAFAQNLGFCADDMDTDFLEQLQQLPES
ncbi:uncharacterized protein N7511_009032 [Penicillium nucicola]|uniref:uncharacterized protein n=1 Tax=Penicillium nucicola TaxID=1850975 RepID=UPI002545534D|nr:uncharacterized protein N7511_009032 [Penicillium nucicola]KAJ5747336.1 hypothetical protein N7511_009032 [Penicillium nucicola]